MKRGAAALACSVWCGVVAGCGSGGEAKSGAGDLGDDGERQEAQAAAAPAPAGSTSPAAATSPATDSLSPAAGQGGSAAQEESSIPLLPGEGPLRDYRLLLVNSLGSTAYVFASAGVAEVVLDTVPPRDSARVDIRVRAGAVQVEARDSAGITLSRTDLVLDQAALNRLVIESSTTGAGPDGPGPDAESGTSAAQGR